MARLTGGLLQVRNRRLSGTDGCCSPGSDGHRFPEQPGTGVSGSQSAQSGQQRGGTLAGAVLPPGWASRYEALGEELARPSWWLADLEGGWRPGG